MSKNSGLPSRPSFAVLLAHYPTSSNLGVVCPTIFHPDKEPNLPFAAPRGPPLPAGLEASATDDQPRVEGDAERRVVVDLDFVEPEYD
jgi:hypothetical protein